MSCVPVVVIPLPNKKLPYTVTALITNVAEEVRPDMFNVPIWYVDPLIVIVPVMLPASSKTAVSCGNG